MRLAALALGAALLVGAAPQADDDSGWSIIQRTKQTKATYSSYQWAVMRGDEGETLDSWTAEFHSGDWHRMEIPQGRIVANCKTHEGWFYDVDTGRTEPSDEIWLTACGIDTSEPIIATDRLAPIAGKDGPLDLVRIKTAVWIRYYAVDRNGVIVRMNRVAANGSPAPCVQNRAIAILNSVPSPDMFSRASLTMSFVPERYRQPPTGPTPPGLMGARCG